MIGEVVPVSPTRGVGAIVTAIKTEIEDAVSEGRELRVQTTAPGCPEDVVNPLDGSSPAPEGGLEIGSVVTGIGDGVSGVSGDLAVGATCYDADGQGGATATCPERGGGFGVSAETSFGASGALAVVAGPDAAAVTGHVVAGYESGVAPGGRYEGGEMPSAFGPVILGFSYDGDTGLVTWDTSGGVSAAIGGVGAVALSGSLSLSPGTYTLTVTGLDGSTTTATVTVPPTVRPVLVDSVGNVYVLEESGGTWSATWYSTTAALGASLPTPSTEAEVFAKARSAPSGGYRGGVVIDGTEYSLNQEDDAVDIAYEIPQTDFDSDPPTGLISESRVKSGLVTTGPDIAWNTALLIRGSSVGITRLWLRYLAWSEADGSGSDPMATFPDKGWYGYQAGPLGSFWDVWVRYDRPGSEGIWYGPHSGTNDPLYTGAHQCLVSWAVRPWNGIVDVRASGASASLNCLLSDAAAAPLTDPAHLGLATVDEPPAEGNAWSNPVWFRGGTLSHADVLTYT